MASEIERLAIRLGSCPSCCTTWTRRTDRGRIVAVNVRAPAPEDAPGAAIVCLRCGGPVDREGTGLTRRRPTD